MDASPRATSRGAATLAAAILFLPMLHLKEYGTVDWDEAAQLHNMLFVAPPILAALWAVLAGRRADRISRERARQPLERGSERRTAAK